MFSFSFFPGSCVYIAICLVLLPCVAVAQQQIPEKKFSPPLLRKLKTIAPDRNISLVIAIKGESLPEPVKQAGTALQRLRSGKQLNYYQLTLPAGVLQQNIAALPAVVYIEDGSRKPKEEQQVSNLDKTANTINLVHRWYPQWNGAGITLSVKEDRPDTADIDFKGRYLQTTLTSQALSSHATIMASMAAGGGNSWHLGKGAAWGSTISSSDFATLLPDADAAYDQYDITIQNHSYGVGIENYYGADAAAYDATALDHPELLHVFSAGNSGASAAEDGAYAGIPGAANLTGSFKMAKNIITAGATDSFHVVAPQSSKGPAYDGRVKPELVAFGEDGSSGAAALVSGVALVLQQQYQSLQGALPPNALTRAILINSANDIGNAGPDYASGFGSLDAVQAIRTMASGRYFSGSINQGDTKQFSITVPEGIEQLKLTLTWNDPPATPNAPAALVHDLDLELINAETNEAWKPWVLNRFPHIDSLQQPATRQRDSINNTEQISITSPISGNYLVQVTGVSLTATQDFYIAYQFDSIDRFEWQFPTQEDYVFPGTSTAVRWAASHSSEAGVLEYSTDNGNNWQLINDNISLSAGYYRWQVPETASTALLRMTTGSRQFVSDTFTIAGRITTGVGFNCPDSFLVYWNRLPGIDTYRVYALGAQYLEPLLTTNNDFAVFAKSANPSLHYAIAPLVGTKEGVKSYTFNYTTQGVACYIRSFFAVLDDEFVQLQLSLGTLYNINAVVLEKSDGRNFIPLEKVMPVNALEFSFTDAVLRSGANTYRIRIELAGGRVVYSTIETVYFFPDDQYLLYPNPVPQQQSVTLLAADPFPVVTLQVYNSIGQLVGQYTISNTVTTIATGRWSKGLYFFRLIKEGKTEKVMKVMVL